LTSAHLLERERGRGDDVGLRDHPLRLGRGGGVVATAERGQQ
jgi:hypothetical protein